MNGLNINLHSNSHEVSIEHIKNLNLLNSGDTDTGREKVWYSSSCPFFLPFICLVILILITLVSLMFYLPLKDTSLKLMNSRIMFLIDNLATVNEDLKNQNPPLAKCCF